MSAFNYMFGRGSNAGGNAGKDCDNKVSEANMGIGAWTWSRFVVAPVTYLGHSYLYGKSNNSATGDKVSDNSIGNECMDANRGIGAAILVPWRRYVVGSSKFLSKSTQFAVVDKGAGGAGKWLFRLDKAHGKGAMYPHINVNSSLTGVRDPHTKVPGALVTASRPVGNVMRNVGDIMTYAAVGIDVYRIGSTAWTEVAEKGGVGAETGKVVAGVSGAWVGGFAGATGGGKMGSMAGGMVAGPVGAGVCGILGAVAGGVGGSIWGRSKGERLVEQQTQTKCKL